MLWRFFDGLSVKIHFLSSIKETALLSLFSLCVQLINYWRNITDKCPRQPPRQPTDPCFSRRNPQECHSGGSFLVVANSKQNFSASLEENSADEEKILSPSNFHLGIWAYENTIIVCVSGKIIIFLGLPYNLKVKEEKNYFFLSSALFIQKRSKFHRRFCLDAPLFIRPFLTYAAE